MAINTTGTPNTLDYFLGRGILYLSELDANQLPVGYRDLGNCPAFSMTVASEELLHQSSRAGLKVTDKRVTLSQDIQITFQLDELSHNNLSFFFTGTTSSVTNPAVAGVGAALSEVIITSSVELGLWHNLYTAYNGTGVPTAFSASSVPVLVEDPAGTPVTLVEGADYDINKDTGLVFFRTDAPTLLNGDIVGWYSPADASAPATLDLMKALKGSIVNYALKFVSANPANGDEAGEWEFHSVQVSADGDLNLIGDEFAVASFTGAAQANSNVNIDGTLTYRTSVRS